MHPVYGDKCFPKRTVHFWSKKMPRTTSLTAAKKLVADEDCQLL